MNNEWYNQQELLEKKWDESPLDKLHREQEALAHEDRGANDNERKLVDKQISILNNAERLSVLNNIYNKTLLKSKLHSA